MSVFGSHGRVRTEEFAAGDVGYLPQGYGHHIENAGSGELELLIVLNDGSYRSISLTAWMASNPHLQLATNFRVSEATFKEFPTREQFMPG
jgi:oxalate decarboxylase